MTTAMIATPQTPPTRIGRKPARGAQARDLALVERIRNGEAGAFEELHRTYYRRIYAFALRRIQDASEAEDVAQDVFLQVHRSIDRFEGRSSLLTWMFGIAHHETCGRFRRRGPLPSPLGDEASHVPARAASVDDNVDACRALAACARALETEVSTTQRRVFEMRYWDNRSVATIACRVGKSPEAIRVDLFRTRRTLSATAPGLAQILT